MSDDAEFVNLVADAFDHLYDLAHLRVQPLAAMLLPASDLDPKERAWQLHSILLNAVEELNPGPRVPRLSRGWRLFRLMTLRYVEGIDPKSVSAQLAISRRHYYREHKMAMEAVSDVLWSSHMAQVESAVPSSENTAPEPAAEKDGLAGVADVVRGAFSTLEKVLRERGHALSLELPDGLPAIAAELTSLRQILLGVVGYLMEESEGANLQVSATVGDGMVRLQVMGEQRPAIAPRRLAEAQALASALEEVGGSSGTRVQPLSAGASVIGFRIDMLAVPEHAVLVVDDNEDVLALFSRYLASKRYRVVTTQSANDAFDLARRLNPRAITLDLMMPEQDGWDLLQLLHNHPATCNIPVVVCSVLKQRELALSLGATAFLEKPITQQALISTIETVAGEAAVADPGTPSRR